MTDRLFFILGDQLDRSYTATLNLRKDSDAILMAEVNEESTHVPSHIQRTILFLSAMRHHANTLRDRGWDVHYTNLDDKANTHTLAGELKRIAKKLKPNTIDLIQPGDWRVQQSIEDACDELGIELTIHEDPHFLCTLQDFNTWAKGRKSLTLEYFYREQRREHNVLMQNNDPDADPVGGEWNFDKENRKSFKSQPDPPEPLWFEPDDITKDVIKLVKKHLPDQPGNPDTFRWPVTHEQATKALKRFIKDRLPSFGDYQDAMWTDQHTLYHAILSPAFNLKLIDPRDAIQLAVDAHEAGNAPINAVEGFVRQILGWREFIRGIYYHQGPDYRERNALEQTGNLPEFYWDADTDMACMKHALTSVIDLAYGHHIARLMVTGNFALISGIHPRKIGDWYLAMYADAIDWASAPNTIGMAMHADNAVVGTKPYAASGKYINRMSNYCKDCPYDLNKRSGDNACPFNTFYWDFLNRNKKQFKSNNRMAMILKNLDRMSKDELTQITVTAKSYRKQFGID